MVDRSKEPSYKNADGTYLLRVGDGRHEDVGVHRLLAIDLVRLIVCVLIVLTCKIRPLHDQSRQHDTLNRLVCTWLTPRSAYERLAGKTRSL